MGKIPFNRPVFTGEEPRHILQAAASARMCGDGPFTQKCQTLMEKKFGAKKVLLTPSCTSALEMSALLLNIQPGDEVIVPSFAFVSTANAFVQRGAVPVFVDIRPDTLNLDENLIEAAITPRTRAIVPIHYAGVAAEMEPILAIAQKYGVKVIEDAAQAINAKYRDRYLGTLGTFGTFSFHESKNIHCGEGGALLINAPEYIDRAEIIREKGTNRKQFFRGEVDKYTWVDTGSSFLLSDILAAYLFPQLQQMDRITRKRKQLFERYL
ncbi:MAG: dTDP-4-amino-4,6-dideoxygalactose transaminase, partial [Calditrichaeota bacterium]